MEHACRDFVTHLQRLHLAAWPSVSTSTQKRRLRLLNTVACAILGVQVKVRFDTSHHPRDRP